MDNSASESDLFQIFANCVKGYQLLSESEGVPQEHLYLLVGLKVEQHRLVDWAQVAGVSSKDKTLGGSVSEFNRAPVLDALQEIDRILSDFGRRDLNTSEPLAVPFVFEEEPTASPDNGNPRKSPWSRALERRFPQRINGVIARAQKPTLQLRWATFSRVDFEKLISKLKSLNNSISHLLDDRRRKLIQQTQQQTALQILQLNNKVDFLVELVKLAGLRGGPGDQSSTHRTLRNSEDHGLPLDLALARFKALNIAIDQGKLDDNTAAELGFSRHLFEALDLQLDPKKFKLVDTSHSRRVREEAEYDKRRVWVEWKAYDPDPMSEKDEPPSYVAKRIRQLVILLHDDKKPEEFRVPRCIGYFDDPSGVDLRFGLVFEKPAGVSQETGPIPLTELFEALTPSLTERIALAYSISNSIMYLHSTNWLHKGLRSANIVFFADKTNSFDLSRPYLTGFDYARPARSEEMTERPPENPEYDIYRHPVTHGDGPRESFNKIFDIYSLGVILFEIAIWKPIDKILGIEDLARAKPDRTRSARGILLGDLERVRFQAGDNYSKAAEECLLGNFGLNIKLKDYVEERHGAQLLGAFYVRVVRHLRGIGAEESAGMEVQQDLDSDVLPTLDSASTGIIESTLAQVVLGSNVPSRLSGSTYGDPPEDGSQSRKGFKTQFSTRASTNDEGDLEKFASRTRFIAICRWLNAHNVESKYVCNVEPSEYRKAIRSGRLASIYHALEETLRKSNLPDMPAWHYDGGDKLIELFGPPDAVSFAKSQLEHIFQIERQVSPHSFTTLFPLQTERDWKLVKDWKSLVTPAFLTHIPSVLGKEFGIELLRKSTTSDDTIPFISVQSPGPKTSEHKLSIEKCLQELDLGSEWKDIHFGFMDDPLDGLNSSGDPGRKRGICYLEKRGADDPADSSELKDISARLGYYDLIGGRRCPLTVRILEGEAEGINTKGEGGEPNPNCPTEPPGYKIQLMAEAERLNSYIEANLDKPVDFLEEMEKKLQALNPSLNYDAMNDTPETGGSYAQVGIDGDRASALARDINGANRVDTSAKFGEMNKATPRLPDNQAKTKPHRHNPIVLYINNRWRRLWRPHVAKGYTRITWLTKCGIELYGDVMESSPGAARDFGIRVASGHSRVYPQASFATGGLTSPSRSLSPYPPSSSTSYNMSQLMPGSSGLQLGTVSSTQVPTASHPSFLLLCVNAGRHRIELGHVDLTNVSNDQDLFRLAKEKYHEIRGYRAGRFSIHSPKAIEFIKFELVQLLDGHTIGRLDGDPIPPEEEVKKKMSYHYDPCPLVGIWPPVPSDVFLLGLSSPECLNIDDLFLNRLPKKLRENLKWKGKATQQNIGWGVYVIEGPNWQNLSICWFSFILFSTTLSMLWSLLKRDVQGGFGIGSFVVAVSTGSLTALFFKWKDI